ncbi:MAG: hypothetical protein WCF54_16020 [Terracidiphilus sp.]
MTKKLMSCPNVICTVRIFQDLKGKVCVEANAQYVPKRSYSTKSSHRILFRVKRNGFMQKEQARALAKTLECDLMEWVEESGAIRVGAVEYKEFWGCIGD